MESTHQALIGFLALLLLSFAIIGYFGFLGVIINWLTGLVYAILDFFGKLLGSVFPWWA